MTQKVLAALLVLFAVLMGLCGFLDLTGGLLAGDALAGLIGATLVLLGWKACRVAVRLLKGGSFLWDVIQGEPRWLRVLAVILLYGELFALMWVFVLTAGGVAEPLVLLPAPWLLLAALLALILLTWYALRRVFVRLSGQPEH